MSPPGAVAVDYAHLRIQAAEDQDVMREVMELFLLQTEQILAALEVTGDPKAWKELTHTLKGSARGVGAFAVGDAAAAAEIAILDKSGITPIRVAFTAVRAYVSEHPL